MIEASMLPGPDAHAAMRERVFPPAGLVERSSMGAVPTPRAEAGARKAKT